MLHERQIRPFLLWWLSGLSIHLSKFLEIMCNSINKENSCSRQLLSLIPSCLYPQGQPSASCLTKITIERGDFLLGQCPSRDDMKLRVPEKRCNGSRERVHTSQIIGIIPYIPSENYTHPLCVTGSTYHTHKKIPICHSTTHRMSVKSNYMQAFFSRLYI